MILQVARRTTREVNDSIFIFDTNYTQRVRAMHSEKTNEHTLELSTEMDIKNPLVEWYIHRFHLHRLVQRERCPGMI
jgi:hypothetical protein